MDVELRRDGDFGHGVQGNTDLALRFFEPSGAIGFQQVQQVASCLFVQRFEKIVPKFFEMPFPAKVRRETFPEGGKCGCSCGA